MEAILTPPPPTKNQESNQAPEARKVKANPHDWPWVHALDKSNTVFIVIDMQLDFCEKGGYVDSMGYDVSAMREPIAPIRRVLDACRARGFHVIHTREGYRPDLADVSPHKLFRSKKAGGAIGSEGPLGRFLIRGEKGHDIIPELYPLPGEPVIDKPAYSAFCGTDLDIILKNKGVTNVVLAGVTTDVCVHSTMREAYDRGYECLLLTDCTAATDVRNHVAAHRMIVKEGGVFGAIATSDDFIAAIAAT
ncbi:isochorismatase hydrolase [Klebsormidium nitens]|uniref:Isochorismatase hydrolase n=1 Tax=Klebsormidium nitens TaxID=105231 RepID=A0A1Y1HQN2_KLENI|nr:isochorismatase hydrolase [Klebsormidium nitens]|eukprot:GAQ79499.1 isochorismatase hydrolase [Klebsormidium nitens]